MTSCGQCTTNLFLLIPNCTCIVHSNAVKKPRDQIRKIALHKLSDPKGQLISKCLFGVIVWTKICINEKI